MRKNSEILLKYIFSERDQGLLIGFGEICEKDYKNIKKHMLIWQYDQSLGGLGGYAAPLSPLINPYNHLKKYRNVFRSLQYARCAMFTGCWGRIIIDYSGLHIETLVKLLVNKYCWLSSSKNKSMLGVNIGLLYNKKIINDEIYKQLIDIKQIYNLAKHDTDEINNITFDYVDGIIFYFSCRLIGNKLLNILNHETVGKTYKINIIMEP